MPKYEIQKSKDDTIDETKIVTRFALLNTFATILGGLVGAFAFAFALILQVPIQQTITSWGVADPLMATILNGIMYIGIAVIFGIILIFVNRAKNRVKAQAKQANIELE